MDVIEAIRKKRAVRQFTSQAVPTAVEEIILNAGRLAQSSKNDQAWHFIVIRDKAMLKTLGEMARWVGHIGRADFAVVFVLDSEEYIFDMGQAAAYMQLAAWEAGIGSGLASIPQAAKSLLAVPDDKYFGMAIAFGYPQERPDDVPRKTLRKPLAELVHKERW